MQQCGLPYPQLRHHDIGVGQAVGEGFLDLELQDPRDSSSELRCAAAEAARWVSSVQSFRRRVVSRSPGGAGLAASASAGCGWFIGVT